MPKWLSEFLALLAVIIVLAIGGPALLNFGPWA